MMEEVCIELYEGMKDGDALRLGNALGRIGVLRCSDMVEVETQIEIRKVAMDNSTSLCETEFFFDQETIMDNIRKVSESSDCMNLLVEGLRRSMFKDNINNIITSLLLDSYVYKLHGSSIRHRLTSYPYPLHDSFNLPRHVSNGFYPTLILDAMRAIMLTHHDGRSYEGCSRSNTRWENSISMLQDSHDILELATLENLPEEDLSLVHSLGILLIYNILYTHSPRQHILDYNTASIRNIIDLSNELPGVCTLEVSTGRLKDTLGNEIFIPKDVMFMVNTDDTHQLHYILHRIIEGAMDRTVLCDVNLCINDQDITLQDLLQLSCHEPSNSSHITLLLDRTRTHNITSQEYHSVISYLQSLRPL